MKKPLFGLALLAALPASAQEAAPFTGLRAEGLLGWDRLHNGFGKRAGRSDGTVYGGQVGYDVRSGGLVLGVEAEQSFSSSKTSARDIRAPGDSYLIEAGQDIFLGARIGYPLSSRALIYGKGGWTRLRSEHHYSSPTGGASGSVSDSGYRFGAGSEFRLTGKAYLKAEYRFSHYGSGVAEPINRHQLIGGVGVRF